MKSQAQYSGSKGRGGHPCLRPAFLRLSALALALLMCLSLSLTRHSARAQADRRLTLMVYLCGSDLEEDAGAASIDLHEMCSALPADGSVALLVLASGARSWQLGIDPEENAVYEVRQGRLQKLRSGPYESMGQPETLSGFLTYAYQACPAEDYALILWDHGAGPMMGVCFDSRFTSGQQMDSLSLNELGQALRNSPFAARKLSWIGFDACLMASMEVASAVAPYAHYMIASQETEPGSGWDYGFISRLSPGLSGGEAAKHIIDAYLADNADTLSPVSLSCIDLDALEPLKRELASVFGLLSSQVSANSYTQLARSRSQAKAIGSMVPFDYDLIDLGDLVRLYKDAGITGAEALEAGLEKAIVYNRANESRLTGLSIYYPFYNKDKYISPWATHYQGLDFVPEYSGFVRSVSGFWLGDPLTDWRGAGALTPASDGQRTRLSFQLSPQQAAQFSHARLTVLEQMENDQYIFTHAITQKKISKDGVIHFTYSGEALYMVDSSGTPLTGSLGYLPLEEGVTIPALLNRASDDITSVPWEMRPVFLVYKETEPGVFALAQILDKSGEETVFGKSNISLSDYQDITFVDFSRSPMLDEDGQLLPFNAWDVMKGFPFISNLSMKKGPFAPALLKLYDSDARYAFLEVYDLQANVFCAAPVRLPSPHRMDVEFQRQTLINQEGFRLDLTNCMIITGPDARLQLEFSFFNRGQPNLDLYISQLSSGQTLLNPNQILQTTAQARCPAGKSGSFTLNIMAEVFQNAFLEQVDVLSIDISAKSEDESSVFSQRASLALNLNVQALSGSPRDSALLARANWQGLGYDLLAKQTNDPDKPQILMRVTNHSREDLLLPAQDWYINGVEIRGNDRLKGMLLPAGCRAFVSFDTLTTGYSDESDEDLLPVMDSLTGFVRNDLTRQRERLAYELGQAADGENTY